VSSLPSHYLGFVLFHSAVIFFYLHPFHHGSALISCSFFLILPCPSSSLPFRVHLCEGNFHDTEELITRSRNSMKCLMLLCLQNSSLFWSHNRCRFWETYTTIIGVISYLRIRQPLLTTTTTTIRRYGHKLHSVLSFFGVFVAGTHN
jgi:hypothetical protein